MELVQDFMPVLIISKFKEDPIKTEGDIVSTTFFQRSRAGNSKVNGQIWLEFEFMRDFMAVLETCKFDDNTRNQRPMGHNGSPE